jgi:Putative MetA-pathway of phenol degradation
MVKILSAIVIGMVLTASPALAQSSRPESYTLLDATRESLFGDVYAEPSRWQPLSAGTFFSEGWTRPWASPPAGEGGAPRQGWLNAFDGVFYRLGMLTGGFAEDFHDNGNQYTAGLTLYAPFSARFEVRLDVPFVSSNRAGADNDYETNFGDLQITPRVLISESRNFTQSFNVTFRIPTGSEDNGNDFGAATPTWEFWWNTWSMLVLRGGVGFALPYTDSDRTRNEFIANLAAGYYFTPHNFTPLGDFVAYLSANLRQPIDDRGPDHTVFTLTPGFRTHLGANWYLLGGVEVPVAHPKAFDFQILGGLMKVF